jgi:hypothetical protein
MSEPHYRLTDTLYQPGTSDCSAVVFAEHDPRRGSYTTLAMSQEGRSFTQWTEELYDRNGCNEHWGARICASRRALVEHVRAREDA